jgi:hypothetical protein
MAIDVSVPIRVRVDPGALIERPYDIEEALGTALARALANSREHVLANRKGAIELTVEAPEFSWMGDGLADVAAGLREDIESQLTTIIEQTAVSAGIHNPGMGRKRSHRPWFVRNAVYFHVRVGDLLEYYQALGKRGAGEDYLALYHDQLDDIRWAGAWLVQVNKTFWLPDLVPIIAARAGELSKLRANETIVWGYSTQERDRLRLSTVDRDGAVLSKTPNMWQQNTWRVSGEYEESTLYPGAWLLFVRTTLPDISLMSLGFLFDELEFKLTYRDVSFLIHEESFQRIFKVQWKDFLSELGGEPATLKVLPFEVMKRVHYTTLRYLLDAEVANRVSSEAAYFGGLNFLNRSTIDQLPAAARNAAADASNPDTLALDDGKREGHWEVPWAGAVIYTVMQPSGYEIEVAQYRPAARVLAQEFIASLSQELDYHWGYRTLSFMHRNFGWRGFKEFEYFLEQLDEAGQFSTFFRLCEAMDIFELLQMATVLAAGTKYALRDDVVRGSKTLNQRQTAALQHAYDVERQQVLIHHDEDARLGVGQVFGDAWSPFIITKEIQQIKEAKRAQLEKAVEEEGQAAFKRFLMGEDLRELTQEQLMEEIIKKAVEKVGFTEDDVETVDLERSVRLLEIKDSWDEGFRRFYVTWEFVERIEGSTGWQSVPGTKRTTKEAELEEMLVFWSIASSYEVWKYFTIGITAVGLIFVAAELGVIAALIKLGGGAWVVGTAVTVSVLIYMGRVIFTDAEWSIEGFLTAALDGYLFVLGFRFGGLVGRAIAKKIGYNTVEATVRGWLVERLAVGAIGGASSGFLTTFSHGAIRVMTGKGDWPTLGEYVTNMGIGLVLGVLGEYAIGLTGIALKSATGPSLLRNAEDAAGVVRAAGISPQRWAASATEALGNFKAAMGRAFDKALAESAATSLTGRIVEITEALGGRYFIGRRVLELADVPLTRSAIEGIERFLGASLQLDDAASHALFRRLAGNQAYTTRVLEAFAKLETANIERLLQSGQLDNFVTESASRNFIEIFETVGAGRTWQLLERHFAVDVTAAEAFCARLVRRPLDQRAWAIDTLVRPNQAISSEAVLQVTQKLGVPAAEVVGQLDTVYNTVRNHLPGRAADVDAALIRVQSDNTPQFLEFLGAVGRGSGNLRRLLDENMHLALANAPICTTYARGGNLNVLRRLVTPGNPQATISTVEAFERLLVEQGRVGLTGPQIEAIVNRLAPAGVATGPGITSITEIATQAGLPGAVTPEQVVTIVTDLIADNVQPRVAFQMLEVPPGQTITDVIVSGAGGGSPDVVFRNAFGGHIGREAVSSTLATVPPAGRSVQQHLETNIAGNIVDKIDDYLRGTPTRRGFSFVSRELDLQIRQPTAAGVDLAGINLPTTCRNAIAAADLATHVSTLNRIRFYDPAGNLIFTWP